MLPCGGTRSDWDLIQLGGGLVCEYEPAPAPSTLPASLSLYGFVNPSDARTIAGGTVMRPRLKQVWDTATQCKIAPSGSAIGARCVFPAVPLTPGLMMAAMACSTSADPFWAGAPLGVGGVLDCGERLVACRRPGRVTYRATTYSYKK